jgi:hypothetical protein
MAIALKNSSVAGKIPALADLQPGELAVNSTDGILFVEKNGAEIMKFSNEGDLKYNPVYVGRATMGGKLICRGVREKKLEQTASSATTALDLSTGQFFRVLVSANTTLVFQNAPAGTNSFSFTLVTVNDATAGRAIAFPANVKWDRGIIPPRTTLANAYDTWVFTTDDGGATWSGGLSDQDVK